ncbi:MAG: hypothetical protein K0S80_1211 [Neobacillus sp.]|nr:hypothetical protein [Neobacillus sp.]
MITSLNGKKSSKTVDRTSINGRILFIMKNMSKMKSESALPRGDRHKTSRREGCSLAFLTDWLMTPSP